MDYKEIDRAAQAGFVAFTTYWPSWKTVSARISH